MFYNIANANAGGAGTAGGFSLTAPTSITIYDMSSLGGAGGSGVNTGTSVTDGGSAGIAVGQGFGLQDPTGAFSIPGGTAGNRDGNSANETNPNRFRLLMWSGTGGSGARGATASSGGTGGNGFRGGGGGGGGGNNTGFTAGYGGKGGNGYVVIMAYK